MGLRDRDYMRDGYHPPRVTHILIVTLIIAFVIESFLMFYGNFDILGQFGLTVGGIRAGKVWQLLTFQFLHAAPWPWHVLLNCLGLYFIGRPVEEMLGARKFLTLYLLAGVAGGLLQVAATLLLPHHPDVPTVGASAGICGIVAVYCAVNPMQELTTWIYFIPVPIRARYLFLFLLFLSTFGTLVPFDNVAHGAHLGGLLLGVAYVRWGDKIAHLSFFKGRPRGSTGRNYSFLEMSGKSREDASAEEFLRKEVDPILEKISAHGIQSLTAREREILEKARSKMDKR